MNHPRARRPRAPRPTFAALLGFAWLLATSPGCASEVRSQEPPPAEGVLAVVGGEEIRLTDLEELAGDQLALLEHQYGSQRYTVLEQALRSAVRDRLLAAEAERREISVDELVNSEVTSQVAITDDEVNVWYQANQARLQGRSLEMLRPAIEQFLAEQKHEELIQAFTDELATDVAVRTYLEPYRADVESEGHPALGPHDAPVTLLEFSDFECPYCGRFIETLERVKSEYDGRIRIVYRQFPLRQIHPNAQKAAEASLCAEEQGRFWELHDLMFAEQDSLDPAGLLDKAGRLGLDTDAFTDCLDSGRYVEQVDLDMQAGQRVGVDGTPALFVNGRPVVGGAVPFETLARVLDEELARAGR